MTTTVMKRLVQECFPVKRFASLTFPATRNYAKRSTSPITAGQPIHETRPHMLKPGELTPGIPAMEYFERRMRLASKMQKNSIAIIPGNQLKYASGAVFYKFQQSTDLFYLTGWEEPDSVAVIEKLDGDGDALNEVIFHMIVPPKDAFVEQWEGFRTGVEGSKEIFNADVAESNKNLKPYLKKLLKKYNTVYYDSNYGEKDTSSSIFKSFFSVSESGSPQTIAEVFKSKGSSLSLRPISKLISELRIRKSNNEINVLKRAGQVSGRAYNLAYATKFQNERTLGSFLEHHFISGGCSGHAYIPVVAGGSNALSIHYTRNDDVLDDDELVLVDAGGMLGGYRADISRTWPVGGKFTDAQKDVYQAVLNVNKKCIEMCTTKEAKSLHDIHQASITYLLEELNQLPGLSDLSYFDVTKLYPHYIGHNLGLDVHDVPSSSRFAPLVPNQVITIEPGVYFPTDDPKYSAHYRGIGVRIEDDVAVGKDSYTVLTSMAAKEVVDLENIAQNGVTTPYESDVKDIM